MDENTNPSPEYVQGFNEGYLLQTYEPEISSSVSLVEGMTERLSGMKDGIDQAVLEQERDKLKFPSWGKPEKNKTDKDKNRSKEMGDYEKE